MRTLTVLALLLFVPSAWADTIVLKDGKTIKGQVQQIKEDYVEVRSDARSFYAEFLKIPKEQVRLILNEKNEVIYPTSSKSEGAPKDLSKMSERELQTYLAERQMKEQRALRQEVKTLKGLVIFSLVLTATSTVLAMVF